MTSSQSHDLDALSKKIDAALTFPGYRQVNDDAVAGRNVASSSCKELLQHLAEMRNVYIDKKSKDRYKFEHRDQFISSRFPSSQYIMKSKVLDDQKLFEAILYSKIFADEFDFAKHYDEYRGQLVWVEMESEYGPGYRTTMLVSQNQIIYDVAKGNIDLVREDLKTNWAFFKDEIANNLVEALVSSSQHLQPAVGCRSQKTSMSDEMKKMILEELHSLNLDPRLRQQFEFDLKLYTNNDVYYWRNRLDGLRCCANSAAIYAPKSEELERLSRNVEELEKMTAGLRDELRAASATKANMTQRIAQLEEVVTENESRWSLVNDILLNMQGNADYTAEWKKMCADTKVNADKLRTLEEKYSALNIIVQLNRKDCEMNLAELRKDEHLTFVMNKQIEQLK